LSLFSGGGGAGSGAGAGFALASRAASETSSDALHLPEACFMATTFPFIIQQS
jgi:hypothetical protein